MNEAEPRDRALREAADGTAQRGIEPLRGAPPPLLNAESAAALSALILAGFVCAAALFRTRLAAGQLDLIASALRVAAVAFVVRALLALGRVLASAARDRVAAHSVLVLGPDGLLLRIGAREQAVQRSEVLGVVAQEALPTRTLAPRPLPVLLVLTPQAGKPRVVQVPPYFAPTSEITLARLTRWFGAPAPRTDQVAPAVGEEAPDATYVRAVAGRLAEGDVIIPEGHGYVSRAPWSSLLGLGFALDLYFSAGDARALIEAPIVGAGALSVFAISGWFLWLRRRSKSRLGIGMLLTRGELLLRGPHGVVSVPWPQLARADVQLSARWSPFLGTYAVRLLTLTTHDAERLLFDASFLGTEVEAVAVMCRGRAQLAA